MSGYWAGPLTLQAINGVFARAINLAVAARQIDLGGAGFQAVGAYAGASFFTRMPELLRAGLPALTEKLSALLDNSAAGHDGTGASNLWPYSTASSTPGLRCRWLSITRAPCAASATLQWC